MNLICWARSSAFRAAAAYGHIPPDGYPKEAEGGEPDRVCLSKANDADYEARVKGEGMGEEERKRKYVPFGRPKKAGENGEVKVKPKSVPF